MYKTLTFSLLLLSMVVHSQNKLDNAITHFKKLWLQTARYPTPSKVYFNRAERIIDLGENEDFKIPLSAHVVYVYDQQYKPAGHGLILSWIDANNVERSFEPLFTSKDACYALIDALVDIRNAIGN
jgi:hypothetical protein